MENLNFVSRYGTMDERGVVEKTGGNYGGRVMSGTRGSRSREEKLVLTIATHVHENCREDLSGTTGSSGRKLVGSVEAYTKSERRDTTQPNDRIFWIFFFATFFLVGSFSGK